MGRIIQIEVPENLELEDYIMLEKEIKEKIGKYLLLSRLNEIVDRLGLTENDLKKFEETRKDVWSKYKKSYVEKGVLK